MITLEVLKDASEVVHYERSEFPVYAKRKTLSAFEGLQTLAHWHPDVEAMHVLDRRLTYRVGPHEVVLEAGDCLVINSRQTHRCEAHEGSDCLFNYFLFRPELAGANRYLSDTFVAPIIDRSTFEYLVLRPGSEGHTEVADAIDTIVSLYQGRLPAFELEVMAMIQRLWGAVVRVCRWKGVEGTATQTADELSLRRMIAYVHENYPRRITLAEIAQVGNVSRNKCCTIFKHVLRQSPVEFLNAYRLEVARNLLVGTDDQIALIATSCGFSSQSYFNRRFMATYGMTPKDARTRGRGA